MPFQASLSLTQLDGLNGFTVVGGNPGDQLGRSVRPAGDVNGDGIGDFIIGAYRSDAGGPDAGSAYVVFGRLGGFSASLDLATLDGTNGFRLDGAGPGHFAGLFVSSAGDLNGDGFDDLAVEAYRAETNGRYSGGAWVVFGKATPFAAAASLGALTAADGFRINSAAPYATIRLVAGLAGDLNGDGFDDLLVTSPYNTPTSAYVLFGKAGGFGTEINLAGLNGGGGFRMTGDFSTGFSGGAAGDVNGDGRVDLLISSRRGVSYVVFGRSAAEGPYEANLALDGLNGANGFIITSGNWSESSAGVGDINNDGFDDLVIGDPTSGSGTAYVVFGRASGPASFDVAALDGTNGFRIDGVAPGDALGIWVDTAGDFNADGIDDLAIGALGYSNGAGAAYVIFGRNTAVSGAFDANFNLNSLTGANGLRFDGAGLATSPAGRSRRRGTLTATAARICSSIPATAGFTSSTALSRR